MYTSKLMILECKSERKFCMEKYSTKFLAKFSNILQENAVG